MPGLDAWFVSSHCRHCSSVRTSSVIRFPAMVTTSRTCWSREIGTSTAEPVGQRAECGLRLQGHVRVTPAAGIAYPALAVEHFDDTGARPVEIDRRVVAVR